MKNRWFLLLSVAFFGCFSLYIKTHALTVAVIPPDLLNDWNNRRKGLESSGLNTTEPRILSTPADGSVFHGDRNVTPGYGVVVSEVWTPTKPQDYYYVKIGTNATGYGEIAFTLNKNTEDRDVGSWRSEPLEKGDGPFTFRKRYNTNIINEARAGYADEISPTTVSTPATGKLQARSRKVVTYGSKQSALTAQATSTGPGIGFVIGKSEYWKFEPGITRDVDADAYNGKYHVTITDTNIGSGSGGMPPSGSTSPSDNTPNCPDCTSHCSSPCSCTNSGTCGGSVAYHPCGEHETTVSGDHSLQASCTSTDANGNSCTVTNFYACDNHSHVYPTPPTPPTPTLVSCSRCDVSYDPNSSEASQHTYQTFACGVHSGYPCSNQWTSEHSTEQTCRLCGTTFYSCNNNGPCVSDSGTFPKHSRVR